jgi:hypothetical protein
LEGTAGAWLETGAIAVKTGLETAFRAKENPHSATSRALKRTAR